MANSRICTIEGCGKALLARGWCNMHYRRWRSHGSPLAGGTFIGEPTRFLEEVALPFEGDECLQWQFARDKYGYGQAYHGGRMVYVHRLVCEAEHGPPPTSKHDAAHACGNGSLGCCNPKHLRWATRAENMADKLLHGTHNRGERHSQSKLTETQVREIRAAAGLQREIAARFGILQSEVSRIRSRKTWGWMA